MSDHLLHFEVEQGRLGVRLSCTHAPDDESWFPRDLEGDFGEPGLITDTECWTLSWVDAEDAETYLVGTWPVDPPSPCPVECGWDEGLGIKCHSSVFAERAAGA